MDIPNHSKEYHIQMQLREISMLRTFALKAGYLNDTNININTTTNNSVINNKYINTIYKYIKKLPKRNCNGKEFSSHKILEQKFTKNFLPSLWYIYGEYKCNCSYKSIILKKRYKKNKQYIEDNNNLLEEISLKEFEKYSWEEFSKKLVNSDAATNDNNKNNINNTNTMNNEQEESGIVCNITKEERYFEGKVKSVTLYSPALNKKNTRSVHHRYIRIQDKRIPIPISPICASVIAHIPETAIQTSLKISLLPKSLERCQQVVDITRKSKDTDTDGVTAQNKDTLNYNDKDRDSSRPYYFVKLSDKVLQDALIQAPYPLLFLSLLKKQRWCYYDSTDDDIHNTTCCFCDGYNQEKVSSLQIYC